MRKISLILPLILFLGIMLVSGCETTKGIVTGIAGGIYTTAKNVGKDANDTWQAVAHADEWIQKNLW
jgi:predicted small secreted protein